METKSVQRLLDQSAIWVRDACQCSRCVDPSTHQRNYSFAHIPPGIKAKSIQMNPKQDKVVVEWENDVPGFTNHVSEYQRGEMAAMYGGTHHKDIQHVALWDHLRFKRETEDIDFSDLMKSNISLAKALRLIERHGLFFVRNVPDDEESVKHLANRLGRLRNTFYGETWDVRSVPQAKNVAYTSKFLGYHMDLLYMREPPGIQLLHTLENTCEGGESLFADSWKALDLLHYRFPGLTNNLQHKIRYTYSNDGYYYTDIKPVVKWKINPWPLRLLKGNDTAFLQNVDRIYWSPPFIGSITTVPKGGVQNFIRTSKIFSDLLESPELTFQTKTEPGTCAVFDNLRVVHARNAFDINSGKRWLKGAYADLQDVFSNRTQLRDEILDLQKVKKGPDRQQ